MGLSSNILTQLGTIAFFVIYDHSRTFCKTCFYTVSQNKLQNKIRPDMIAYSSHNILKSLYSFKLQRQKRHKMKFLQAISFYSNGKILIKTCIQEGVLLFSSAKNFANHTFYQKSLKCHYLHNRQLRNESTLRFATRDQIFTFLFFLKRCTYVIQWVLDILDLNLN